jgi:hypothetical protein
MWKARITRTLIDPLTKLKIILSGMILLVFLAGCMSVRARSADMATPLPTPTLNAVFVPAQPESTADPLTLTTSTKVDLFASADTSLSSPTADTSVIAIGVDQTATLDSTPSAPAGGDATVPAQSDQATPTPSDPLTPMPDDTATPVATPTPAILPTVTIYDETLNGNWSLVTSSGVKYVLQNRTNVHSGTYSIALIPTKDYGNLAFTVKFGSKEAYLRDQTLGVRFWLYSGDATVGTEDLAVSVVGSNDYAYWKWNDTSVTNTQDPVFPETRLYYLGFNNAIPPNTWVQVEVWLDDLQFEPQYKYITGISIKNGEGFRDAVYIDQLELVKKPES